MYAINQEARQKSHEIRVLEDLLFFTYSLCGFNNIVVADIVSFLRVSRGQRSIKEFQSCTFHT